MNIWKKKNDDANRLRERSRSQPTLTTQTSERNENEHKGSPKTTRQHTSFSICCESFSKISPNAKNDPERGGVTWIRDASVTVCGGCNDPFTLVNRRVSFLLN